MLASSAIGQSRQPDEPLVLARTVVIVPESREDLPYIKEFIRLFECRVALEAPISGVIAVVVPLGDEAFFSDIFSEIPGVRWAGREYGGSAGLAGCNSSGGVMSEPYNYPGPESGNDADFDKQWYLENTGHNIINSNCGDDPLNEEFGEPGVDINIRNAWAITQGCEDVVVAVFDSGIQYEHPAFDYDRFFFPDLSLTCASSNFTTPYDCCPVDPQSEEVCAYGFAIDTGAHGTQVAGVIGAQGNNQNTTSGWPEIAGVDLHCNLLSVRTAVNNAYGSGGDPFYGATATLVAMETIASLSVYDNVRVINMSYSLACHVYSASPIWDYIEDAIDVLVAQDRVVICISTNFGDGTADLWCPARWDNVITVAGVNNAGARWSEETGCSGRSGSGTSVDVAAAARAIFASPCDPDLSWGSSPPTNHPPESPCYNTIPNQDSGTSGAAPQVSGVVALLVARADELGVEWSFDLCRELLTNSATPMPPGSPDATPNQIYGYGLVNAYGALRQLELIHYRPYHRADLTTHNDEDVWRFGIADGVTDCEDLYFFVNHAYPGQILEKADFTTTAATLGQPGYGVPDGYVTSDDYVYYTTLLFPAAVPGGCD